MDLNRTWGRMEAFEALAGAEGAGPSDPSGRQQTVEEGPSVAGDDALGAVLRPPVVRGLRALQEEPEEGGLRRWVATLLGASVLSAAAVTFAVAFGDEAQDAAAEADPLAALAQLDAQAAGPTQKPAPKEASSSGSKRVPQVDPAELSFPDALLDAPRTTADVALAPLGETRPEVAVTMAAAEAELQALDAEAQDEAQARPLPAAALASGEAAQLGRVAAEDPLVAGALPRLAAGTDPAPQGRPGRYVLQVASYPSPDEAEAFAQALRRHGHPAFVQQAEVPERGPTWRVQIGPFDYLGQARRYAQRFEATEAIHPVVVRRREPH